MNWDDLRYILALHRHDNLTSTARALHVSRTTVSRRIKALEDVLDARLMDASSEGIALTDAGFELVRIAEQMEQQIQAAQGRILGRDVTIEGRLRVTMLDFIYEGMVGVFASFMTSYPGVELSVITTDDMLSLRRREADVAIRLSNQPTETLIGRKLGKLEFALYASKALLARIGPERTLNAYPWIHDDERGDTSWLDQWLARHAPLARVALRQDSYMTRRASIRAGIGVGFLPCFDADRDPQLVCLGHHLDAEERHLWVLTLDELRTNVRISTFMAHVHEAFLSDPNLLASQRGEHNKL